MRDIYVRASIPEDVDALIPNIPIEDNEDVIRGWGMTSSESLRKIFPMCDECFSIIDDGEVVGMFGVLPDGNVWLMRARGLDNGNVALRFVRHGHEHIERWLQKYGRLIGYISKDYKKFIRWLVWEGFEVTDIGRGYVQVDKWASR